MHTIEIDRLTKNYGSLTAVDDLSFTAEPGRVVGFLGPNGSGKTTTLQMLLGLARPDRGSARINGQRYADLTEPMQAVGALLDAGGLHPGRSGRTHLRIVATAARIDPSRIDEVLHLVGMEEAADRRVKTYSLGMRQRIGIATALLGDPGILVLDEPANGLDPAGMRWIRDLFRSFADAGRTVLISSHVLAEIAQTVDDLIIIGHGRLLAAGPIADMTSSASLEDTYLRLTAGIQAVR